MKIAIFTPYAFPEMGACSFRIESFRKYFESEKIETAIFSPERKGIGKTPDNYYRYNGIREAMKIVFDSGFDLIIGTSPPLTHSLFVLIAAKIKGVPVIIDLRDPWTHAYEGLGIYKNTNPKLWIYKFFEFIAYNFADKIFVVTQEIKKIAERNTLNRKKISLIPNGTNLSMFKFDDNKGKKIRKNLGIPQTSKVCIYAGAFVKKDVEVMIESISGILKETKTFLILVIPIDEATKNEYRKLQEKIRETGIKEQTKIIDSKNFGFQNKLFEYYSACDFALNPLPKGMSDYCIPAKTYDYFACNLPVVAKGDTDKELAKIITKNNLGWFASTWEEFNKKVVLAIENTELKKIGKKARKNAEEKFDRKYSNEKALRIIKELIKKT